MAQTEQQEQTATEQNTEKTEVRDAQFSQAEGGDAATAGENLDVLLDINMPVTINLGRTSLPLKNILQLGCGSVLQLDKAVNQPAEIYVQDIKFATGDIVVVDGKFGIRIRRILDTEPAGQTEKSD